MSAIFSPPKPPRLPQPVPLPPDPAIAAAEQEQALLSRRRRAQAGTIRARDSELGTVAPVRRPLLTPAGKTHLGG